MKVISTDELLEVLGKRFVLLSWESIFIVKLRLNPREEVIDILTG